MAAWREQPRSEGPVERPIVVHALRMRSAAQRVILWAMAVLVMLAVAAVIAILVLTGTDWGRERVRRFAQNSLNGMIHGKATIGKLSGNLLVGMTVHDLTITDSAGTPFLAVESFRGDYSIAALLRKRIWINHAVAVRPLVVLDKPPHGRWNWQRIFPRDTTHKPPSQQTQWGDWLRFMNAQVVDGQLIVRTPWTPSKRLSGRGQDSVVRDALGGGTRLMIEPAPGGYQKRLQLDSINAIVPLLRLSEPGFVYRLAEVSELNMRAFPFRPPAALVRDVKGSFRFTNDSAWWKGAFVALPDSRATGDGSYSFDDGDLTLALRSDHVSFPDLRWIYPRLPGNGRGRLDLALSWRGAVEDYQFSNADVSMGAARARGTFGIRLEDTVTIHNTNLQFSQIDTRTLEQLMPGFRSPRRGVFAGRAKVSGGRHALLVDGDVTFDDERAGRNRIIAAGTVGFPDRGGIRASDLRTRMLPLQVAVLRSWYPSLPVGGELRGSATLNGSTTTQLAAALDITHVDGGEVSSLTGSATLHLGGAPRVDADVIAHPVSLVTVGRFMPSIGLQGSATGPVHLIGSGGRWHVETDVRLQDRSRVAGHAALDAAHGALGYDFAVSVSRLDLHHVVRGGPLTLLNGQIAAAGSGTALATLHTTVAADFTASKWDSVGVDTLSVRGGLANGLATVQHAFVAGSDAQATLAGSFGLVHGAIGQLSYTVHIDSLGAFNRWLPKATGTTADVAPRPMVVARAERRARDDSARVARATEMQRAISGKPGPTLNVAAPAPVPRDTIEGSIAAAGTLRGNIYDFDLRGRAAGEHIVARGSFVRAFHGEYAWTDARSPNSKLAVAVDADSLTLMGFGFDTASARLTYASSAGHAELSLVEGDNRHYSAKGDYQLRPDHTELRLSDLTFRFDTAYWALAHPSTVQWSSAGVHVNAFELRNRADGRIYANGLLPTSGVADFVVEVDNFPLSNIADLTQTDIPMSGTLILRGSMTGTTSNPAFRGALGIVGGTYNGAKLPNFRTRFGYADERLVAHGDVVRADGTSMATVDAQLPLNLALTGATGDRLLSEPMAVDIVGDSLPIDLIPQVTDLVTDVHGRAAGKIAMRGTVRRPSLAGGIVLDHGSVTIASTGATIDNIVGRVRMVNDTVYVDTLSGTSRGEVRVRGTIAVGELSDPVMNLFLVSSGAQLFKDQYANIRLDAGLALAGPISRPYLSGAVTVDDGVIYASEPGGQHLIGAGDPALFNVLDTARANERDLFPPPSPFLSNLRAEVTIAVKRNTWVRNREANIEIYTDDPVFVRAEDQSFIVTGVVATDRGEYTFLSKRFQITRGSAMFVGSPDLNPTLQITGEYQVEVASRGALNIRVLIGGTLKSPTLTLSSDAQPPKTQSELLSFLAFGQSTASLISSTSSSIAGTAATLDLFGAGAQVAARRLASVALGVAVDQIEIQAGRAFGTDVFDITPADVPTELATGRGIGNFLTQTRFEAGKYVNPRTFVSIQTQAGTLGGSIEHRTADGWRFNATIEPRLILLEPTLTTQPFRTVQSYGGFVIREWRF